MANATRAQTEGAGAPDDAGEPDYDEEDLRALFTRGNGMWRSWNDAVRWLEQTGGRDAFLTPGQAEAISEDFAQLEKDGVPFVRDPRQVYVLTHKERYRHEA